MAEFNELMSDTEEVAEVSVTITQQADGSYLVEEGQAMESTEMGETAGTSANSLDEAFQIARGLFDSGSGDTAAFNEGFGEQAPSMKKPGMI